MTQGPTMRVAELVVGSKLSDIPAEVIRLAKGSILDTLGVALAGRAETGGRIIVDHVRAMDARPLASVFGAGFRTVPDAAALANGTNAAILDYDDTTFRGHAHLSGSLVTSTLALGEARRLSGRAVLEAYIVGFEAGTKIGLGLQPGQISGGHHSTGTVGVMASAAACAKLLGLDPHRTAVALGIAGSCAGALRAAYGTMTKGLHSGVAASNAVLAASLASEGFTARPDIIEAKHGYAQVTVKDDSYCLDDVGKGWGAPWDFIDPGVGIKFQPSGSMSHCAGQIAKELALRHDLHPDEVESIQCKTTEFGIGLGRYTIPTTANEAMYSTPWAIAVALTDRKNGLAQFSAERVKDPAVLALAAKVKQSVHPDLANITDYRDVPAAEVIVTLKDGRSYSQFLRRQPGYPGGAPWTDEMLEEKFRETAGTSLPTEGVERTMALVRRFEELADLGELAAVLRGEGNP